MNKKQTYYVIWTDIIGNQFSDIVQAKSIHQAWTKVKWKHIFSVALLESMAVYENGGWREI